MLLVVSGCSMLKPHEVIKARGAGDAAQAIGTDCDAAATDLERWLNQLLEDGPVLFDVSPRPQAPVTRQYFNCPRSRRFLPPEGTTKLLRRDADANPPRYRT